MTAPVHDRVGAGHERPGATFWVGLLIGGGVMAFGIRGVLMQSGATDPSALTSWVIGADLLHDLLIAPIAVAIGWGVNRAVPGRWRVPVQAGLIASAITLAIGWPGLRGYGRHLVPDNPSVQPLNYAKAVVTVLAIIWGVVALWLVLRTVVARRPTPTPPDRPKDQAIGGPGARRSKPWE